MTLSNLRSRMVATLLGITLATIIFFLLGPALGYPLEFDQAWALAQISIPVFIGYFSTTIQFAIGQQAQPDAPAPPLLAWLIFGPAAIYLVGAVVALIVFWSGNRAEAPLGTGMSTGTLSTILTVLLSILAATSNVAIAQLFKKEGS
jgi:hypothetical protein